MYRLSRIINALHLDNLFLYVKNYPNSCFRLLVASNSIICDNRALQIDDYNESDIVNERVPICTVFFNQYCIIIRRGIILN